MTAKTSATRTRLIGRFSLVGAVLGIALSSDPAAAAASLSTSTLKHTAGVVTVCAATNIGTVPVEIEVDVYRYDVLISDDVFMVAPQATAGTTASAGVGLDRCVFLIKGSPKKVRASIQIVAPMGETIATTPAQ